MIRRSGLLFSCLLWSLWVPSRAWGGASYVIMISVDGLGSSYLQTLNTSNQVPTFRRLMTQGSYTLNARNDYDVTVTLPNHTSMVTGMPILGANGHNYTSNSDPAAGVTLHNNKGSYIPSVFDVVHDNGKRTAMYATKSKFSLFDVSYDATNGALDKTGVDNGRDKINTYYYNSSSNNITTAYIPDMQANPYHYSFLHYHNPDSSGHGSGWGSTTYMNSIVSVDGYIGRVMTMIDTTPALTNNTLVIVTADHGGKNYDHSDPTEPLDYTIPFMVWGPGVQAGGDLYTINAATRQDPGTSRPYFTAPLQPIRNSDAADLAVETLGFGRTHSSIAEVVVPLTVPEPGALGLLLAAGVGLLGKRRGH